MARERSEARSGWAPSNTHPPNTRIIACNIDTLHLSYFGRLEPRLAEELATKRAAIEAALDSAGESAAETLPEAEVVIDGEKFALELCRAHGYRYRLVNADLVLMVRPESQGPMGCVRAQFSSVMLWHGGWAHAIARVELLVRAMLHGGVFTRPHAVSRLDMCVDFQGWIPVDADLLRCVTRATYNGAHHICAALSGFSFGRGEVTARIYDKTLELAQSGKEWMRAVWESSGYDVTAPVWRLEFELRREALRQMRMGSLPGAFEHLGRLWEYLTTRWLRLTMPGATDRRERWKTDPAWEVLADAWLVDSGCEIVRVRKHCHDRERLLSGIFGGLKSLAALDGHNTLGAAVKGAEVCLLARMTERGERFEALVEARRRRAAHLRPVA